MGRIFLAQGSYDDAQNLFGQALTIQQAAGDRAGEVDTLAALGMLYTARGEGQTAAEYFSQVEALRALTTPAATGTP
jgi:TolA-binding protein